MQSTSIGVKRHTFGNNTAIDNRGVRTVEDGQGLAAVHVSNTDLFVTIHYTFEDNNNNQGCSAVYRTMEVEGN